MSVGERVTTGVHRPAYETTAERILALIATADLQPGDRLPTEIALSAQLGVGRTVVREAVRLLTASGRLRARRGSGVYVTDRPRPFTVMALDLSMPVDPEHIVDLYDFRALLEAEAARLAAERITPRELRALHEAVVLTQRGAHSGQIDLFDEGDTRFHEGITAASRNPFLAESVVGAHKLMNWALSVAAAGATGSHHVGAEQHAAILAAIRDGQADAAATAMREHVRTTLVSYQQEVRRRLFSLVPAR